MPYQEIPEFDYTPRQALDLDSVLPAGAKAFRLESYRTSNVWWKRLWAGKYKYHMLAICDLPNDRRGVYDITDLVEGLE